MDNTHKSSGRVFCIGRNYVEHVRELSNELPGKPVVFLKPAACLAGPGEKIRFPAHGSLLHHEVELVLRVGKQIRAKTEEEAVTCISHFTLGLDLTLRDLQDELRQKGLPWEKAKAFEQSAPLGDLVLFRPGLNLQDISFTCRVNGEERQKGNTGNMIFSIGNLLIELSGIWELRPGDLIFTGTPAGVGPLAIGDTITIESKPTGAFSWTIVE
jgi:2-keto-4-pentenoate hydratase/2-oxohepta-3-ene-1,7-dioic acid hydratase in catechol pathway